jgi:hypothetical protein
MAIRSDRLKKLEAELTDLEQWLRLGLVPKKDIIKHEAEIENIRKKIDEEKQKLLFLKETGEAEEYVTPRRQAARTQYTETPTLPDLDVVDEAATLTELSGSTAETLSDTPYTEERSEEEEEEGATETGEDDDPFSDRNRWRRGMLHGDDEEW